jgi:hypothetical protein
MAALMLLDDPEQSARGFRPWLAGILLIATVMTRAIGVALPLAVLIVQGVRWRRTRQKPDHIVIGFAIAALLSLVAWEIFTGSGYAADWFRMVSGENPWIPVPLAPAWLSS